MSKQFSFSQEEVEGKTSQWRKDYRWFRFTRLSTNLGFKITVAGGAYLTHELNGDACDFKTLMELTDEVAI